MGFREELKRAAELARKAAEDLGDAAQKAMDSPEGQEILKAAEEAATQVGAVAADVVKEARPVVQDMREAAEPVVQDVRKAAEPVVSEVRRAAEPLVDRVSEVLMPDRTPEADYEE